jgi:hypothetical protein
MATRRDWLRAPAILPVAFLVPLLAVGFAFALGPSPRKVIAQLEGTSLTDSQVADVLRTGPAGTYGVLTERVSDRAWSFRAPAIEVLGETAYRPALPVLLQIANDGSEVDPIRRAAKDAVHAIESAEWSWARATAATDPAL